MRPVYLELEGFASFRERTTVDFTDVDLFVFTGPTGSGKSSLIDAMIFALFGKVHRYDDDRLVGAAVTTGMSRAKVSFTFTVDGVRYRAVRLVKLTGANGRATTPEARLEQVDEDGETLETLAGSAAEVTSAVTELLGLNFTEFCRVVVLPQGAFQRFMHATAKERRELLFRLLNLGIVDELAGAAREKHSGAKAAVEVLNGQLEDLAHATPDAISAANDRHSELVALLDEVKVEEDKLAAMKDKGADLRHTQQQAERELLAVSALTDSPTNVASLSDRIAQADQAVDAAEGAVTTATEATRAADAALDALPAERVLLGAQQTAARVEAARAALTEATAKAEDTESDALGASEDVTEAQTAALAARVRLDRVRETRLAHTLAQTLEDGDDCPVCFQHIDSVPDHGQPADVHEAEQALERAESKLQAAQDAKHAADKAHSAAEATTTSCADTLEREQADYQQAVAALPDDLRDGDDADAGAVAGAVAAALAAREEAAQVCEQARAALTSAESKRDKASEAREKLTTEATQAWDALGRARDTVATLDPPAIDRDGRLADAWTALSSWAEAQVETVTAAKVKADAAIATSRKKYLDQLADLRYAVTEKGVYVPEGDSPRDKVVEAVSTAKADHDRLQADADKAAQVEGKLKDARRREEVTAAVAKLLDSRNFSSWVGNRVLLSLTAAASSILNDLTGGTYSLTVNDKSAFEVIDHANADEVRSAKTLSGGETFLASLALALALAEHVTSQSAGSTSRLESLMLDEGFGTLDTSTLDAVASAIEELGDRGRMVGIVTHIRDLAERSPVRFEVSKDGDGSKVDRVTV